MDVANCSVLFLISSKQLCDPQQYTLTSWCLPGLLDSRENIILLIMQEGAGPQKRTGRSSEAHLRPEPPSPVSQFSPARHWKT